MQTKKQTKQRIPASIVFQNFEFVTMLNCSHMHLKKLPDDMIHLEILDCSHNQLRHLPVFQKLKEIRCGNNQLRHLPDWPEVLAVYCEHNRLRELPNWPRIAILKCSSNEIHSVLHLETLETLICRKTRIIEICGEGLKFLDCSYNQSIWLYGGKTLQYLNYSNIHAADIPVYMLNLQTFICHRTKLSKLPIMPNLQVLKCSFCNFNELPKPEALPELKFLKCSGNRFHTVPAYNNLERLTCKCMPNLKLSYLPKLLTVRAGNVDTNSSQDSPNPTWFPTLLELAMNNVNLSVSDSVGIQELDEVLHTRQMCYGCKRLSVCVTGTVVFHSMHMQAPLCWFCCRKN